MKIRGRFVAGVAILLVLSGIASFARSLQLTRLRDCTNNLRNIASAKGSYGLESGLSPGDRAGPEMISPLLKGGWQAFRCPSGGQYEPGLFTGGKEIGDVRDAPTCSVHGSLARLESTSRGFFAVPRPYFLLSFASFVLAALMVLAYLVKRIRSSSSGWTA